MSEYPQQYQQSNMAPMAPKTNTMAIVGLILAFVFNIAGLIISIIARNQIKQTGEGGAGLALAGIIISAVSIVLSIAYFIFVFAVLVPAAGDLKNYGFVLGF